MNLFTSCFTSCMMTFQTSFRPLPPAALSHAFHASHAFPAFAGPHVIDHPVGFRGPCDATPYEGMSIPTSPLVTGHRLEQPAGGRRREGGREGITQIAQAIYQKAGSPNYSNYPQSPASTKDVYREGRINVHVSNTKFQISISNSNFQFSTCS